MAGMTNSICNDPSSLQYTFIESKFVNDPEDAVSNGTAQSLKVTIPLKVNTSAFTQISTPKGPAAISVVYYGNLTDSPIPVSGLIISCAGQIILNSYSGRWALSGCRNGINHG